MKKRILRTTFAGIPAQCGNVCAQKLFLGLFWVTFDRPKGENDMQRFAKDHAGTPCVTKVMII